MTSGGTLPLEPWSDNMPEYPGSKQSVCQGEAMVCRFGTSPVPPDPHVQEADDAPQVLKAAPKICGGLIDIRSGSGPGAAPHTTRVFSQSEFDFLQHPDQ